MNKKRLNNNKTVYSFTLVELMIVIVILAILGGVVYLILRPNKTINKAQDTQRVYDLRHITEYISTAELGKVVGIFNYGDPNIVYVSLPDTSATCASYTLPTLPPGYTYHCSTQENYKKPDGTGWIPIIFEGDLTGYSISGLPVDPVNQPPYYYTYFPSSSYELTALLSEPNSNSINDNGLGTQTFETGTPGISTHTPIIREPSLVGYWSFNEGDGSYAYDYSGHNNTGTLYGGPIWTTLSTNEKVLSFDGDGDYVNCGNKPQYNLANTDHTIISWIKTSINRYGAILWRFNGGTPSEGYYFWVTDAGKIEFHEVSNGGNMISHSVSVNYYDNQWHFLAVTVNITEKKSVMYFDGIEKSSDTYSGNLVNCNTILPLGGTYTYLQGYLDDVRLYHRALSAGEIQYLYTKTQARYK